MTEESSTEELTFIDNILSCKEYSILLPEIIWSAFNYVKQVPNATFQDAMNFGVGEWIK